MADKIIHIAPKDIFFYFVSKLPRSLKCSYFLSFIGISSFFFVLSFWDWFLFFRKFLRLNFYSRLYCSELLFRCPICSNSFGGISYGLFQMNFREYFLNGYRFPLLFGILQQIFLQDMHIPTVKPYNDLNAGVFVSSQCPYEKQFPYSASIT